MCKPLCRAYMKIICTLIALHSASWRETECSYVQLTFFASLTGAYTIVMLPQQSMDLYVTTTMLTKITRRPYNESLRHTAHTSKGWQCSMSRLILNISCKMKRKLSDWRRATSDQLTCEFDQLSHRVQSSDPVIAQRKQVLLAPDQIDTEEGRWANRMKQVCRAFSRRITANPLMASGISDLALPSLQPRLSLSVVRLSVRIRILACAQPIKYQVCFKSISSVDKIPLIFRADTSGDHSSPSSK